MKTVLITGASGGIGRALCTYFADRGMRVLAHARNEEKANSLAGASHTPIWGDVTKPDDVTSIAKQVKTAGGVDWVVHNAGLLSRTMEKGHHGLGMQAEVNVLAPYALTKALVDQLQQSNDAKVFLISSTASMFAFNTRYETLAEPNGSSLFGQYALSKSAANAVIVAISKQWPDIFFASTEPGFVKTKMTAGNPSMPFVMSKLAGIIGASPNAAAKRCFDFLLEGNQTSGVVVHGRKIQSPTKSKWVSAEAQASLSELFEKGGINLS